MTSKLTFFQSRVEVKSQPNPNTSSLTESYGVRYRRAVESGGRRGHYGPSHIFTDQLTLSQLTGQIMPIKLLLATLLRIFKSSYFPVTAQVVQCVLCQLLMQFTLFHLEFAFLSTFYNTRILYVRPLKSSLFQLSAIINDEIYHLFAKLSTRSRRNIRYVQLYIPAIIIREQCFWAQNRTCLVTKQSRKNLLNGLLLIQGKKMCIIYPTRF